VNITERLRLELVIREQINKHGDDFYTELSKVLEKIQDEKISVRPTDRDKIRIF